MSKKNLSNLLIIAIALVAFIFSACAAEAPEDLPKIEPDSEVYRDETMVIAAGETVFIDEDCFINLKITNLGERPMLLCGSVGVRANTADGADSRSRSLLASCAKAKAQISDYSPIDGLLAPGQSVCGYICVSWPEDITQPLNISIATDYINDIWVSFGCLLPGNLVFSSES